MKNRMRGFTFIEVLLGLSIFSIIALSVYAAFGSALRIERQSKQVDSVYREAHFAFEAITQDIENMIPFSLPEVNSKLPSIEGNQDSLTIVSAEKTGIVLVSFYLEKPEFGSVTGTVIGEHFSKLRSVKVFHSEESNNRALIREEKPWAQDSQENIQKEALSFLVKEDGLNFSYAYVEKDNPKTDSAHVVWKDKIKKGMLPLGVRVQVIFLFPDPHRDPLVLQKDIFIPAGITAQ